MTRPGPLSVRLLAESLLIIAVAAVGAGAGMARFGKGLPAVVAVPTLGLLICLLAAPWLYWRAMHAVRQGALAREHPSADRPRIERLALRRRRAIFLTAMAHLIGLMLTGIALGFVQARGNEAAEARFATLADRVQVEVLRRFDRPLEGLKGARATFAVTKRVDRQTFREYVGARNIASDFPGVKGFSFVQRVLRDAVPEFIAAERADGMPDFGIKTAGQAADLYVVRYVEPLTPNFAAIGFDIGSEATRREAVERAVSLGDAALTGKVRVGQGERKESGFLYILPLFRDGADPTNAAQRRKALLGLVVVPLYASDLLGGAAHVATDGLARFDLFDGEGTVQEQLAYSSFTGSWPDANDSRPFEDIRTIAVGGRLLTLRIVAEPAFAASLDKGGMIYVAGVGAFLSMLLAALVWSLASSRVRAQTLAERMTTDIDRLAQVVRHTDNAVTITDRALRITWVNEGFTRISGYSLEQSIDKTPGELLASGKADPTVLAQLAQATERGEACRVEILNRARDGREYWIDTEIQPTHSPTGELTGFMEIGTDITERKLARQQLEAATQALARERQRLDDILRGTNVGTWEWNARTGELMVNERWAEIFGYSLTELAPIQSDTWNAHVHPEDLANAHRFMARCLHGEVAHYECELRMRHRDGHWVWVLSRGGVASRGADGAPEWVAGTHMNISERKLAQAEAEAARAAAEQASLAKGQFVANMSHEIRTPMNAILGMLKLLLRTSLTARQKDYAAKTERAAQALLGLLNDILDFSKIEAGKLALDPRPFELEQVFSDLSVILSANLGNKPVEVLYDIDPKVPKRLIGDDARLQQILVNLAGNAIKFTAAGEVVVGVRCLAAQADRVRLVFSVRDTGIGISQDHQQRIFSAFSQAEASTSRRFGGTGLGLSICQRLVVMMGGSIRVQSTPGVGSTFRFEVDFGAADADVLPQAAEPGAGDMRVLVVDDNPSARGTLLAMAASLGWQADAVPSGEHALAAIANADAASQPYSAIFVDWQMPGLDGWQTSRRIREMGGRAIPLVMMVTASGREKLAEKPSAEQSLLDGYLVKPVTPGMLREAIEEARGRGPGSAAGGGPGAALSGMRLLVVEDNAFNRQVAQELLEGEGATVALADDGAEGLALLAAHPDRYHAVLMDIQMPVMDGHTAACKARQELGLKDLPIIAMTANALASDRDASLAAGMNDHVGKPFDLDELVATLRRHVQHDAVIPDASRAKHKTSVDLSADLLRGAVDHGIELAEAITRLGGKVPVWLRTVGSFVADLPRQADELDALVGQGQLVEAARLMHTLKGISGTLGASTLAHYAAATERRLLQAQDDGQPREHARSMRAAIELAATNLQEIVARVQAQQPAEVAQAPARDPLDLSQRLEALAAHLCDVDMQATDVFAEIEQFHGQAWRDELRPLADAMASLDFDGALSACKSLMPRLALTATP